MFPSFFPPIFYPFYLKFPPSFHAFSAVNASAGFVGSAIIVQNVTGHTALKSASACLVDHMGAYLQRGVLPANGTLCQPDALPFGLLPDGSLAPLPNGTATAAATGAGTTATTT